MGGGHGPSVKYTSRLRKSLVYSAHGDDQSGRAATPSAADTLAVRLAVAIKRLRGRLARQPGPRSSCRSRSS